MITKVTGIIVNTTEYGETSLIMQVFTKEYGIIGIMGKGVRSLKSHLRALTMKLTYGTFYIYYKENKLSILKDVDIINPLLNIHQDITLISYYNYICELATQVYKQSEENEIYELMMQTILKINDKLDPQILTNILEIKLLDYLGVGISLDACVGCGNQTNIVTIDGDRGGLICKHCYRGERMVKPKTIQILRMLYYVDIKSISKLDFKDENKKEIDLFLNTYYSRYTGLYLQSKEFLNKLIDVC